MLLENRNCVIYGGGGAIGGAVARRFVREGARVFLAGRTQESLEAVAGEIGAETAVVDALDERAVEEHADAVGRIDVSFNLIGHAVVQGTPMTKMEVDDYLRPIDIAVRSGFITARAAARRMKRQGSGVILWFGGEGHPFRGAHLGALQTIFHAIEAMRRQLATELGAHGIRVVTLRTGGIPETIPQDFDGHDRIASSIRDATLLGRAATLDDVAATAAFVASDEARAMTGATVNVSAGTLLD